MPNVNIDFGQTNFEVMAMGRQVHPTNCHIGVTIHDDVNQMEPFSALLAICAWNLLVTSEFPAQRPATRSFDVFLICAWINGWENNRDLVIWGAIMLIMTSL